MFRKILIFTVLAVAVAAAIALPLWKSDAAQPQTTTGSPNRPAGRALPNFDIRLTDGGEFNDLDLSSIPGKKAAMQDARTRSRASAVEQFRSSLQAEHAKNLRAVVNETGGMKNLRKVVSRNQSPTPALDESNPDDTEGQSRHT
jgi:hypothetical protein